jgi:hypothetical protein
MAELNFRVATVYIATGAQGVAADNWHCKTSAQEAFLTSMQHELDQTQTSWSRAKQRLAPLM